MDMFPFFLAVLYVWNTSRDKKMSYDTNHAAEKTVFVIGAVGSVFAYLLPLRVFKNVTYVPKFDESLYCGIAKWQVVLFFTKLFYLFILSMIIWGYFLYAISWSSNWVLVSSDDDTNSMTGIAAGISAVFVVFFMFTPQVTWSFLGVIVLIIGLLNVTHNSGLSSTTAWIIDGCIGIAVFMGYGGILMYPCAFLLGPINCVKGFDVQWHFLFSSVVAAFSFAVLIQDWTVWLNRSWADFNYLYLAIGIISAFIMRTFLDQPLQFLMPWLSQLYDNLSDIPVRQPKLTSARIDYERNTNPFDEHDLEMH